MTRPTFLGAAAAIIAAFLLIPLASTGGGQSAVTIDDDDVGGVVASGNGPEAGVWVIAETHDLPTGYRKIAVTDDQGRYLLPDLPEASYSVWVRGYGLVDSPKVQATPGQTLDLTAIIAPDAHAAAQYYPAQYWYALLEPPPATDFPGTGFRGNGISVQMKSRQQYMGMVKTTACGQCHQMGGAHTREMPKNLGEFDSTFDAWDRRIQSGQAGAFMDNYFSQLGRRPSLEMFADWTDRIVAGELPPAPPRPQGIERNIVVTIWDWAGETSYTHDEIATDKRNPTVNAYGPIFGSEQFASEGVHLLDPIKHETRWIPLPVRDVEQMRPQWPQETLQPSPNWGEEIIWKARADTHNPMMDSKGRTWFTANVRPQEDLPPACSSPDHPSGRYLPLTTGGGGLAVYDPKTEVFTRVELCNGGGGGHLQFADDENETIWFGTRYFSVKIWEETGDALQANGWTTLVADTNGNGQRDPGYVALDEPVDPTKDHEVHGGFYGVIISPVDGSVWGSQNAFPGGVVRMDPGSNPASTALAEFYEVPLVDSDNPSLGYQGYTPRGIDIDRNGVVWTGLSGSGHLASFERRKCTGPLTGPDMLSGQTCPEGWTLYQSPGPNLQGVTESGSADMHYFNWVDQFNTSGLGENTPFLTGNNSDSLIAFVNGEWVTFRVPYPLGFFAKGMDGRIDDPNGGWKGRGLWATNGSFGSWHQEGGKGQLGKVYQFQVRPDPLAK